RLDSTLDPAATRNADRASTAARQRADQRARVAGGPVVVPSRNFGRRSLRPLMHWEGVVDRVGREGFLARLTPFEDGVANSARVEFTEFSFQDLANPTDRGLVQEGARFYWTIGKATNPAGTLTNVSLVRFRRLLRTSVYRRRLADAEAAAL